MIQTKYQLFEALCDPQLNFLESFERILTEVSKLNKENKEHKENSQNSIQISEDTQLVLQNNSYAISTTLSTQTTTVNITTSKISKPLSKAELSKLFENTECKLDKKEHNENYEKLIDTKANRNNNSKNLDENDEGILEDKEDENDINEEENNDKDNNTDNNNRDKEIIIHEEDNCDFNFDKFVKFSRFKTNYENVNKIKYFLNSLYILNILIF